MEVKPGYKMTEVGEIPAEWEIVSLAELFNFQNGVNAEKSAYGYGVPFVNVLEVITNATIDETKIPGRISLPVSVVETYAVRFGDVLFNRTSEVQDEVALASVYLGNPGVVFGGFVIRGRPKNEKIDPLFSSYALRSSAIRSQMFSLGQGAVRANIGQKTLSEIEFCLPTKAEQEAIASALSDIDALIESLEELITKKRNIKQGAMQDLLTGKRRLSGFSGKWGMKRLGDLFEITSSTRVFQNEWRTEGIPFYRARELAILGEKGYVNNELFIERTLYESHKKGYGVPQIGDMLVTGVGTLGKVYVVSNEKSFYFKDGNIIWFKIQGKMNVYFLQQLFLTKFVMKQIVETSAGTTVGTYTISDAKKTEIPFPSLDEQLAIATILLDMDAEINVFESKLTKARHLKQAMMQELLTGRIRLV